MSRIELLGLILLCTWPAGCAGPDAQDLSPIASLSSGETSATFTAEYWHAQAQDGTGTWKRAVELCRRDGHRQLPNCETVGHVRFLRMLRESAKRRSKPYDGEGRIPYPDLFVRTLETGTDPLPAPLDPQDSQKE